MAVNVLSKLNSRWFIALYVLLIHIALLSVILKKDIKSFISHHVLKENKELTPHYFSMVAYQQRVDKNLSAGSNIFIGDSLVQGLAVSEITDKAVNFGIESRRASISAVQRKLRIGYNRAARLIETMEEAGLVSEMSSNGSREVLVPKRD